MKKQLVFATNNAHKLEEVRGILGDSFEIRSLKDINCLVDIPETGETLRENALIKAQYVKDHYGLDCFADDTGLEVEALGNAPGVYSARYAGEDHNSERNIDKLLRELDGCEDRKACFKTVIACIFDGEEYFFEGRVDGEITPDRRGAAGFGYDPVFLPVGSSSTFAEMGEDAKNKISHRALAIAKFRDFLDSKNS